MSVVDQRATLARRALAPAFCILFLLYTICDVFSPYWSKNGTITEGTTVAVKMSFLCLAVGMLWLLLGRDSVSAGMHLAPPRRGRWEEADEIGDPLLILRLFAFLCVWMTHSALLLKPNNTADRWWHFLTFGCAHQGMAVFFTLSGYLMGKAFACGRYLTNREGILKFYHNRILRIVPLYIFAQAIVLFLVRPELLGLDNWASLLRILTFTYYSSPTQAGPIGALWSLSTEMQFYLLVPFIYSVLFGLLRKTGSSALGMLITLSLGCFLRIWLFHIKTDWQVHRYTPLFINLDLFVAGLMLNGLVGHIRWLWLNKLRNTWWLAAAFFLTGALYVGASAFTASNFGYWVISGRSSPTGPGDILYEYGPTLTAIATVMIIFCFEMSVDSFVRLKHLGSRPIPRRRIMHILEYCGVCTYGLYIWHPPVLEAFNKVVSPALTTGTYFCRNFSILMFCVFALANATYFLVEKPFARLKSLVPARD
jgi:peptidoglycan/LPS O-acetylase OafA/YrhL